jgi:hypothetical protein
VGKGAPLRDEFITVIGDVAAVRSTNKATRRRDGKEVTCPCRKLNLAGN